MIQILEDMLRSCVLDFGDNWYKYLPLYEFAYDNNYHSSIGMTLYEALYGKHCMESLVVLPLVGVRSGISAIWDQTSFKKPLRKSQSFARTWPLPRAVRRFTSIIIGDPWNLPWENRFSSKFSPTRKKCGLGKKRS